MRFVLCCCFIILILSCLAVLVVSFVVSPIPIHKFVQQERTLLSLPKAIGTVTSSSLTTTTTTTTTVFATSAIYHDQDEQMAHIDYKAQQKDDPELWMQQGLLFSSFSDGLRPNPAARSFLKRALARSILKQEQALAERSVEASAKMSPCCGPTDVGALADMERADDALRQLDNKSFNDCNNGQVHEKEHDEEGFIQRLLLAKGRPAPQLRLLYVPTAMYALRRASNSTPGKQRQRARADGKKRRTEIVNMLQEMFRLNDDNDDKENSLPATTNLEILTITLDLDDGSVKQPASSKDSIDDFSFPTTGKEAVRDWEPHLVYVDGGNTFWLYHCMEKGNWGQDFIQLAGSDRTVFCGSSAGAIVAGSSIDTACWKGWDDPSIIPGRENYNDWKSVPGLSLVGGFAFFPHYSAEWMPLVEEKRKQASADGAGLSPDSYCCLSDQQVCCVDGSSKTISIVSVPTTP